ncbi:hypothetical protein D3C80_2034990 [compost metagenome]
MEKPPLVCIIFMVGTSVSPSPRKIIRSNGMGRSSSGMKRLMRSSSQWLCTPLLMRNRYWVLVV